MVVLSLHGSVLAFTATRDPAGFRASHPIADPERLEILTVTARRFDEPAQQVPVALNVISGADLSASGFYRGLDLAERVPTLQVQVPSARLTSYRIRGLGSSSFNDGLESSVSMFVDGVYLGRQGMFLADLDDLQRVEVLRGPQGTLFGKNSSAGAISIITRGPTRHLEAGAEAILGSDGLRQRRLRLSGSLSDALAGRISFYQRQRDGRVENGLSGRKYNDEQRLGVRGQLLWTPNDDLSLRLIAEYDREEHDCCVFPVKHYSDVSLASADFLAYRLPEARPFRREVEHDTDTVSETRQRALTLVLDLTLAGVELTSITAWRDWQYAAQMDLDGIGLAIVPHGGSHLEHSQFSQEIRMTGRLAEQFRYVTGIYYLKQNMYRQGWLEYGENAADWYAGAVMSALPPELTATQIDDSFLAGAQVYTPGKQQSDHRALFGQLSWQLTPRLELSAGLRYNQESKRGVSQRRLARIPPLPDEPFAAALGGILHRAALGAAYYQRSSFAEHQLSGQLTASYQFDEKTMAYVKWAQGYKGGGINAEPVSRGVPHRFDAEQATMLEIGVKRSVLDQRGWVNLAVYQTDVEDYQALTYNSQSLTANPQRDNLMNVGKVRARGIDIDTHLRWSHNIDLRFGLAWSDARYREFDNAPCPPGSGQTQCDLGGKRLSNAPAWNLSTGIGSHHSLTAGIEFYTGVDYQWQSGFYGTVERGEGSYQSARGIANWHIGLRNSDARWDVAWWVRNLFDKDYISAIYALTGSGDYGAVPGDPRSFGMSLRIELR